LTLDDLAQRMSDVGRPMRKSGIGKIEQQERRVDADDLVALALALGVSPLRLLLPGSADTKPIELTATCRVRARDAWRWASGEQPLSQGHRRLNLDLRRRFVRENRPHNPPDETPVTDLVQHGAQLRAVADAVAEAEGRGISRATVVAYLQLLGALPEVTDGEESDGQRGEAQDTGG
jgi:transcriptional regulator with XRE-family HTH domain